MTCCWRVIFGRGEIGRCSLSGRFLVVVVWVLFGWLLVRDCLVGGEWGRVLFVGIVGAVVFLVWAWIVGSWVLGVTGCSGCRGDYSVPTYGGSAHTLARG